jgi:small subunit ribosomal protein S1
MADNEDFASLLSEFERAHPGAGQRGPKVGDKVKGKVLSVGAEQVLVDLGGKFEGVLPLEAVLDGDHNPTVKEGDRIEAVVVQADESSGSLVLGSKDGGRVHDSAEVERAYADRLPVEGLVTATTKGGVEVQIAGLRGFCPASQLALGFTEDLQPFVGQRLSFRITRFEGGRRGNLVVSRRELLEEEQRALAAETRARIEVGAVLQGTVTSLQDYGAFVDLGGIEGMVHISELGLGRVGHPKDLLSVGQRVDVAVLRIEQTGNPKRPEKIALSIRALAPDPWEEAERRYPIGAQVAGNVTRLQPFGAFVELEPGIEGMVHISELGAGRRVGHPHEVLKEGERVEARVLSVDREKRRIGLSLDSAEAAGASAAEVAAYSKPESQGSGLGTLGELLKERLEQQKGKD